MWLRRVAHRGHPLSHHGWYHSGGGETRTDTLEREGARKGTTYVNLQGEVIGVNTAIVSRSGGYMGIGFAIPINMVKAIEQQLVTTGKVTRGYLGVRIQDLTEDRAKSFGVEGTAGALVGEVAKDTPAEKGRWVNCPQSAQRVRRTRAPGQTGPDRVRLHR
jgi:hypothetical protein